MSSRRIRTTTSGIVACGNGLSSQESDEEDQGVKRGQLGPLTKGRRITGPEREQIAASLRDRYAQGASIRDLVKQTGRSYGWTHRVLRESGVVLRGRGGAHPVRRAQRSRAATTQQ